MIQIIQQRDKCIGCRVCAELASQRWCLSRKDGRCNLIGAKERRGFYKVVVADEEFEANHLAAIRCPEKIIKVQKIKTTHAI